MKKIFKKGDFIRIIESTHDDRMPSSRMGHLLEPVYATVHYSDKQPQRTQIWYVYMTNGAKLKFHEMFMEHVDNV
tara:strand:- start:947 stop:1171 length:225 start_codon:yes stop_codon:yes gene_type:complete